MKDFAASTGRLRALSPGAKLLYTAFALSAIAGLFVSWRLYGAVVSDGGAASYYSGAPVPVAADKPHEAGADDGPVLDLPDEVTKPRVLTEQISDRKLLEVTHFHLFSIPVYVLILAHLWLLAKIPTLVQSAGVVLSVATSALHVAAPWLVRSHVGLAPLVPISGAAMLVTLSIVALVPAIDMWLPRRPGRASAEPARDPEGARASDAEPERRAASGER